MKTVIYHRESQHIQAAWRPCHDKIVAVCSSNLCN